MRLIILLVLIFNVSCFKMNMISDTNLIKLNKRIESHKINSNKIVRSFVNGEMTENNLNKFMDNNLFLYREYSLCKFYKFLEDTKEAKEVIFNNIKSSNRLGFNELDILRKNKFVLIYSKRGSVLGALISIKIGKGDVVIGYTLSDNEDYIPFNFGESENKGYLTNLLIKRIVKDDISFILVKYVIDKFLKKYMENLRIGINNYDINNKEFIEFYNKLDKFNILDSLEKVKELDDSHDVESLCDGILNDLDILLNRII